MRSEERKRKLARGTATLTEKPESLREWQILLAFSAAASILHCSFSQVQKQLGKGSFGTVYLVSHRPEGITGLVVIMRGARPAVMGFS